MQQQSTVSRICWEVFDEACEKWAGRVELQVADGRGTPPTPTPEI